MRYRHMLVTGGAGFIGSSLAVSFKRAYPRLAVTCLDSLKRRGSELNIARLKDEGIAFVHGDIRSPEDLVLKRGFDLMLECSAEPSVLAGYGGNPAYIINTNLAGTIHCLEAARRTRADVVFLSTSRVYPFAAVNALKARERATRFEWQAGQKAAGWSVKGITEQFTTAGAKTLYGATKLSSEMLLTEYCAMYGMKGIINRCGVIAGPWQFGKVDQGVFTLWMLCHYFKKDLDYIGFGGKGKQVRDLLHVDDLFRLINMQVLKMDALSGNTYNVGGGTRVSLSLLETTRLCESITGNRLRIGSRMKTRPGDIRVYLSDASAATRQLGWKPRLTAEQTLVDIYHWIRSQEKSLIRLL